MVSSVAAVVVHHRSYDSVGQVVDALILQGLKSHQIVLVDNSEEPARRAELRNLISDEVAILFENNLGYGAAVNVGFEYFRLESELNPEFFLVSTHESRPAAGAVLALVEALRDRPRAAVAGPTLLSGSNPEFVWSAGGYLKPWSHIPTHFHHRDSIDVLDGKFRPEPRAWLDGAFLLYRWEDFREWRMAERFFLYMEETDLHLNFAKAGREAIWVPASRVWQDSRGIPPFYLARNLRILFAAHENILRRIIFIPVAAMRRVVADIIRRRDFSTLLPTLRGLTASIPREPKRPNDGVPVVILNPLGAALRHYESEVVSVLEANGRTTSVTRILEPSAAGDGAAAWMVRYLWAVRDVKRLMRALDAPLLVLWPVLGYWDVALFWIMGLKRVELVMHDPVPMVKAVGYSRLARKIAARVGRKVRIVAHSDRAVRAIMAEESVPPVQLLPHPILEPVVAELLPTGIPVIRVVGQYKKDRDLDALSQIASELRGSAMFEIHGRGWPEVQGWKVSPGFVEEGRLSELIAESTAIVIPYKSFFQSGIAIRALELGVPAVGPRASVLGEMFGHGSRLLIDDDTPGSWVAAVRFAIGNGHKEAAVSGQRWRAANISAWSTWTQSAL